MGSTPQKWQDDRCSGSGMLAINVQELGEPGSRWERGQCPVCGDTLRAVTKSGKLRVHKDSRTPTRPASIDGIYDKVMAARALLDEALSQLHRLE